jgi:PIN domain nuclease of toxin-antitoxin system
VRLLLDTHIWVWSLSRPDRIKPDIQKELQNKQNELWLSPVSIWEFLLLHRKRRLIISSDPFEWIDSALKETPMYEATLNFNVAIASEKLRLKIKDPADRFLAATASIFNLTLVTADRHFRTTKDYTVLSA